MVKSIKIDGKKYKIEGDTLTGKDIKKMLRISEEKLFILKDPETNILTNFDDDDILPERKDAFEVMVIPKYISCGNYGFSPRERRILKEASLIKCRYDVVTDTSNINYILVKGFSLKKGFSHPFTSILMDYPKDYPQTALEHFYLRPKLTYKGKTMKHYFEKGDFNKLSHLNWAKYCIHLRSWKPKSVILKGDSGLIFLEVIKTKLDDAK